MPNPTQVAKAKKLIRLMTTPRFDSDPAFALAVLVRYQAIAEEDWEAAEREAEKDPQLNVPVRRGRRLDLEAEFQARLMENPDEVPPLFIKVVIAGSGNNGWETQLDDNRGVSLRWERADDTADEEDPTRFTRDGGKGAEIMFAGPGASNTKGGGESYKGTRDIGSNSIDALVANVPPMIAKAIDAGLEEDPKRLVYVLIKAHSRGAVASGRIANKVKADYPQVKVELTQMDPVPGQWQAGENLEITLGGPGGAELDETTLVYSVASGWNMGSGFTPQKVHGAKRMIISRQGHSSGLKNGYTYDGELYKGNALNSLAQGVYVDMNQNDANDAPLVRVDDIATARAQIDKAYKQSQAATGDYGRMDIVRNIMTEFLKKAGA